MGTSQEKIPLTPFLKEERKNTTLMAANSKNHAKNNKSQKISRTKLPHR